MAEQRIPVTGAARHAAVVLSALGAWAAFPPMDIGAVAWVALAPLVWALLGDTPRGGLNLGFLWGAVFFGAGLHWFPGIFGWPGVLLIGICALFPALAGWATARAHARWGAAAAGAVFAVAWTGIEFFRGELWILKFPWLGLGYSQHMSPVMLQSADVAGVYGLTFLIALVNAALALAMVRARGGPARGAGLLVGAAVLAAGCAWVYGRARLGQEFGCGAVQLLGVQDKARVRDMVAESQRGLDEADARVQLVVWPEYAVGRPAAQGAQAPARIAAFARRNRVSVLYGGREMAGASGRLRNTAYLISDQGQIAARAVKRNPVPFLETSEPGRAYAVMQTRAGRLGVGVCFDMDFEDVSRNLAARGAEVLVFPTADMWSWGRVQHAQHAGMTALRAVETRRPVFRVASSGVSQAVDAHGRVVASVAMYERGCLRATLRRGAGRTIFVRGGYLFPWLCLVAAAALGLISGINARAE